MFSKRYGLLVVATVFVCATNVRSYVVPNYWCDGLPCAPDPIMHDPDCHYEFVCNRTEGAPQLVVPGTPTIITSASALQCDTCCDACDDEEPPTLKSVCTTSLTFEATRSFTFTFAPGLAASIVTLVRASLETQFAWNRQTTISVSGTVGSEEFPSCQIGRYNLSMTTHKNAQYSVFSAFHWTVQFKDGPSTCATGTTMNKSCYLGYHSYCTGTIWGDVVAKLVDIGPCP